MRTRRAEQPPVSWSCPKAWRQKEEKQEGEREHRHEARETQGREDLENKGRSKTEGGRHRVKASLVIMKVSS